MVIDTASLEELESLHKTNGGEKARGATGNDINLGRHLPFRTGYATYSRNFEPDTAFSQSFKETKKSMKRELISIFS